MSANDRRRSRPLSASASRPGLEVEAGAQSRFDASRRTPEANPRSRREASMKITDVTLTLFSWESIPSTIYGHHTARPTGNSDLGLLRIVTDEGIEGNAFLGTSSNPASLDGPGLIRFLKPLL